MQSPFKDLPREIKILTTASFFVAVGFGIVLPAIPVFARTFGVNNTAVGLIVSTFAITRFASGLISGKLVDRFGERVVFSSGVGMVAFFVLLAGLAQSYGQLLFFRAAGGLGSSMFTVAAGSVIMRAVDDNNRARAFSIYNGAFLVGGISGPAIGGLLSLISLRAPFFAYSITLTISGLIALFFLKGVNLNRGEDGEELAQRTSIAQALSLKPYRIALVISFIGNWVLFGVRSSILPIFVIETLRSTPAVVGYGFTLSALMQGLLLLRAGKISDTRGRKYAAVSGSLIALVGLIVLIFTNSIWMYFLSMAFIGLGGAFLAITPSSIVGDVIRGKSGQVIGLFQMAGDAGMMVGPIVLGWFADTFSYQAAFISTAVIFLVSVILSFRLPETRKSHTIVIDDHLN
jgi:MFS family permease